MSQRYDVIVVGVGAMGSAACYHLAKRGARVLGIDQFSIPNSLGSSHGDSRIIRLCYYEHPDYVPLLLRAYELWRELETSSDEKLLHITGAIYMGREGTSEFISGAARAAREHSLDHEVLSRAQLRTRYPQFHVPEDYAGFSEPHAGFLLPERVIAAHARLAMAHGAQLRGHTRLCGFSSEHSGVAVRFGAHDEQGKLETAQADHLIFCGGAWSDRVLGGEVEKLMKLQVTRQALGWVWPRKPELFQLGVMPIWAIDHEDGTQHYGFPMHAFGRPGFKIAHHFKGEPVATADALQRTATAEDEADFRPVLQRYIPDADGPLLSMAICMYTNTPDSHFVIDAHPNAVNRNMTIACGFSGHGFKFASVVGEVLADLALTGRTAHPIEFLGLTRFRDGNAR
jgi:sarcosine oxidase